jgi:hypothetical protein
MPIKISDYISRIVENSHLFIDDLELPTPIGTIQKWPMVESIVVGTVGLGVIRRCQYCHLVPVDCIAPEKVFDFVGHHTGRTLVPHANQFAKHTVRAAMGLLSQTPVFAQFVVGHSHVLFVRLCQLTFVQGFQFGRGRSGNDLAQYWQIESEIIIMICFKEFLERNIYLTFLWNNAEIS